MTDHRVTGLLLAAGGGSRMGMPKALVRGGDGVPWVVRSVRLLMAAGCSPVVVVVGARASEVEALLALEFGPRSAVVVAHAEEWASGMAASLRAGLAAVAHEKSSPIGVLVTLVDLPELTVEALERVLSRARANEHPESALVRAAYDGMPGHPVFIGRRHWAAVAADVSGDAGAGRYLRAHNAQHVDCSDLGGGDDRDTAR
ncbi:nucleotidyltransferase family protein [Subtercola endophyticus]|uniref:nucleotidyltransferase family protein n=1 Tax=Subtercola endophyticus TaxID=2895559 RepID=UPI001E383F23|nr:nucleotidyltransferase family protein [Subtercola endophyticus]UFS61034.1 nucleotidyltransferase family protein [Subtercola endophyticus]